jgi:trans-aconitate methyltransferase
MGDVNFGFWDQVDKSKFLLDDADNPAREFAAEVILACAARIGPVTVLEVGPGPAIDYERFYRRAVSNRALVDYILVDGSQGMVEHLKAKYPEAHVVLGNFSSLPPKSADIVYTKATFEHQPAVEEPLRQFLAAARYMAVINWYRPPTTDPTKAECSQSPSDNCYYATWSRQDVVRIILDAGWEIEGSAHFENGNEVWRLVPQSTVPAPAPAKKSRKKKGK